MMSYRIGISLESHLPIPALGQPGTRFVCQKIDLIRLPSCMSQTRIN